MGGFMEFDYYQYEISTHFASAIINGDYSGLTDNEIKELDLFLNNLPVDNGHFELADYDGEGFFSRCEISGLYDDLLNFRLYFPLITDQAAA
jgi:tRNA splicing ligase